MAVETLFQDAPAPAAFRAWRQEKDGSWHSEAAGGDTAKVWLSAVSRKWVLTVDTTQGHKISGRVLSADEGKGLADGWLAELRAQDEPAPVKRRRGT